MKKEKKGFTLLELVIVIAVFAVLMAILIPTFTGIIRRAKLSADQTMVKNLNTMAFENEKAFGKATTIREAIAVAKANNFDVEKLTPTADGAYILWDSVNDRWILFDAKENQIIMNDKNFEVSENYKLWNISTYYNTTEGYSVYLKDGYNGTADLVVTTGIDVGHNTNIDSIKYERVANDKHDVLIYTNGGALTVYAPKDTVYHYGETDSINIIAVANASYHEYGSVKFIEISSGRYAIEETAKVNHIHINAKEDSNGQKTDEFNDIIISYDKTIDLTEVQFSRDNVEIASEGTLVVALQSGTEEITTSTELDYVWLTKQGIYEQIKVSDNDESAGDTWLNTSDKSAETKDTAQKIANNIGRNETTGEIDDTIIVGTETYIVTIDEDRNLIVKDSENNEVAGENLEDVITEIVIETGVNEEGKDQIQKSTLGYVAKAGDIYYFDAELAFNSANPATDTVIIVSDCKINISNIPNDINFDLNGKTISRSEISERYIQLGNLPYSIWDYSIGGYITDTEKWFEVNGTTYPLYDNGWLYPTDYEIFEQFYKEYPECVKVVIADIDPISGKFEGNSTALKYFAGGYGTESDPFIISNEKELSNINGLGLNRRAYYKLVNDLTTSKNTFDSNYDFDLNNHTITKTSGNAIFWAEDYLNVHNGNIVLTGNNSSVFGDNSGTSEIHATDLVLTGNVNVSAYHYGALIKYLGNTANNFDIVAKMYVTNVRSSVNIKSNSATVGGLIGYCLNSSLALENVAVYSNIETGNTAGGIIIGDSQVCEYGNHPYNKYMTVSNVKFYGNILVPSNKKAYYYGYQTPAGTTQDDYKGENATITKGINIDDHLIITEDNEFVIVAESQYTKYIVRYQFSVDYESGNAGGYPRNITKEFEFSTNENINTGIFKNYLVELRMGVGDTLVSDEFNSIFTREGLENTYCYDGKSSFVLSSHDVTVYLYAYTGESLKAIGRYSYNANMPE